MIIDATIKAINHLDKIITMFSKHAVPYNEVLDDHRKYVADICGELATYAFGYFTWSENGQYCGITFVYAMPGGAGFKMFRYCPDTYTALKEACEYLESLFFKTDIKFDFILPK